MEIEGLKRALNSIGYEHVKMIVTDRHLQIAAWLRDFQPVQHIVHLFDVWHVAKCKLLMKSIFDYNMFLLINIRNQMERFYMKI